MSEWDQRVAKTRGRRKVHRHYSTICWNRTTNFGRTKKLNSTEINTCGHCVFVRRIACSVLPMWTRKKPNACKKPTSPFSLLFGGIQWIWFLRVKIMVGRTVALKLVAFQLERAGFFFPGSPQEILVSSWNLSGSNTGSPRNHEFSRNALEYSRPWKR